MRLQEKNRQPVLITLGDKALAQGFRQHRQKRLAYTRDQKTTAGKRFSLPKKEERMPRALSWGHGDPDLGQQLAVEAISKIFPPQWFFLGSISIQVNTSLTCTMNCCTLQSKKKTNTHPKKGPTGHMNEPHTLVSGSLLAPTPSPPLCLIIFCSFGCTVIPAKQQQTYSFPALGCCAELMLKFNDQ